MLTWFGSAKVLTWFGSAKTRLERGSVGGQVFGLGEGDDAVCRLGQGALVVVDDVDAAQERLHGQPAGVAGAAARGQHVVGAGEVVAERDRRVRADEDRTGVADLRRDGRRLGGVDLQVLGGVRVHDLEAGGHIVDQHDAGLAPGERRGDALGVLGARHLGGQLALDRAGQLLGVGDQHGGGQRVVLGLADQVGGDVDRVGGAVGEDRDLGRARLGVDADHALEQAFGRGHENVAGAGDEVDRTALLRAVGEHRDRLRAARRVHLVDAEQRARGEDDRVRQPAELLLRGRGDRERGHAGLLRGHDVHHHAGGVDGLAARDVQADPLDRHPALGDGAARDDLRGDVGAALVAVDEPGAAYALLQRVAYAGVEALQGLPDRLRGHARRLEAHAVETLGVVPYGGGSAMSDVVADGPHLLQGGLDVELGSRQHGAQVVRQGPAQIDTGNHLISLRRPPGGPGTGLSR